MIVTIEWMEEWFRRFDQEYFGGKLPVPELGLTHAKTRLGQLAYKRASRWGVHQTLRFQTLHVYLL